MNGGRITYVSRGTKYIRSAECNPANRRIESPLTKNNYVNEKYDSFIELNTSRKPAKWKHGSLYVMYAILVEDVETSYGVFMESLSG
jgi:hypothetical protein